MSVCVGVRKRKEGMSGVRGGDTSILRGTGAGGGCTPRGRVVGCWQGIAVGVRVDTC